MRNKIIAWLRRFRDVLPIAALLAFMYCVFGSLEVVLTSAKDFSFTFNQALLPLSLVCVAVTLVFSAVMACFRGVGLRIVTGLFTGVALCSYLQNLVLNLDLGMLEGEEIDWTAYGNHGMINLLVWVALLIAILIAAILLKKHWRTVSMCVCGLLLIMQVSALAISAITYGASIGEDLTKRYALDGEDQYTVSTEGNIIMFVVDYCANTYYDETVAAYP